MTNIINYNIDHICVYNSNDLILKDDNVTKNDIDFIRNFMYKNDLLNIFNLTEQEEQEELNNLNTLGQNTKITKTIDVLYELLIHNNDFNILLQNASLICKSNNLKLGIIILFSFDLLHDSHIFFCDYLKNGKFSQEYYDNLMNSIKLLNN